MRNFYRLPLGQVLAIMFFFFLSWTCLKVILSKKHEVYTIWHFFNIVFCFLSVLLIARMTLFERSVGEREWELLPFYTLTTISYNDEAFRTMLMNVALFFPFGLTFPYVLEKRVKRKHCQWFFCIMTGIAFSIGVELLQFYFCIGRAETDDVICNSAGCAFGVLAYVVAEMIGNRNIVSDE